MTAIKLTTESFLPLKEATQQASCASDRTDFLSPPKSKKILSEINKTSSQTTKNITSYNIEQINKSQLKNPIKTKILLVLAVIGALSFCAGLGGLSFINMVPSMPQLVALSLTGGGLVLFASIVGYNFIKNRPQLNEITKTRVDWFLDSNLNDVFAGLVFLMVIFAGSTASSTLLLTESTINWMCSILMFTSALMQLIETCKSLKNAKDKEDIGKEFLNLLYIAAIVAFGVSILQNPNSTFAIISNLTVGITSVIVAAIGLKNTWKKLKEVSENEVDENNEKSIIKYLENTLDINDDEKIKIINKINNTIKNDKNNLIKWLEEKKSNDNNNKWIEHLLEKRNDINLEEATKLITEMEIASEIDSKIENFRSSVNENIYLETLKIYNNLKSKNIDSKTAQIDPAIANELKNNFKSIKKNIKFKAAIEVFKMFVFGSFAVVPGLSMANKISDNSYNWINAGLSFGDCAVNINPNCRNVPPAINKEGMEAEIISPNYKNKVSKIQNNPGLFKDLLRYLGINI